MPTPIYSDSKIKIIFILGTLLTCTFVIPIAVYIILSKVIPLTPSKEKVELTQLTSPDLKELTYIPEKYKTSVTKKAYEISEFGQIAALKIRDNGQEFYLVNGHEEPRYDSIEKILFSPDGERYAYKAKKGEKNVVVLDGKEIDDGFEAIINYSFTADSKNFFIRYIKNYRESLLDTNKNETTQAISYIRKDSFSWPNVSADGKRIAFLETVNKGWERYFVIDGKEQKHYDSHYWIDPKLTFSPDSKRFAYSVNLYGPTTEPSDDQWMMVIDGDEQKPYDSVNTPQFSPDGNKFAYITKVGTKSFVVLDGEEGKQYDKVFTPVFSPDSNMLIYFAEENNQTVYVVDGQEGKTQGNSYSDILFSPDSKNYYFQQGNHLIKNGEIIEGNPEGSLTLSPDGTKLAYVGRENYKTFVVINGVKEDLHNGIDMGRIVFSPNSQNYAYMAQDDYISTVFINGKKGKNQFHTHGIVYDDLDPIARTLKFSSDGKKVTNIAYKDDAQYLVTEPVE